jgi:hypothetical protein
MISNQELMSALIAGRSASYLKKSEEHNPYMKALLYDWEFRLHLGGLLYTDSYRGFNPYGGVEYIFENGRGLPITQAMCAVTALFRQMMPTPFSKRQEAAICTAAAAIFSPHMHIKTGCSLIGCALRVTPPR